MGMDVCLRWEGEEVLYSRPLLVDLYGNLEHVFIDGILFFLDRHLLP